MRIRRRSRATAVALALTASLAGCATTEVVRVPVPVPCVAEADVPAEPEWLSDSLPPDASAAEIVRAMGVDLVTAVQHAATLRTLIGACTDGSPSPL